MRAAALSLLLAVLVGLSSPAVAQDDDEVTRLRNEVRQLRDLVKELTMDLVQWKARVRALEDMVAEHAGDGEAAGASEAPEGPAAADLEGAVLRAVVAGTYRFDPDATREEFVEWRLSQIPEEERESARPGIVEEGLEELDGFNIELTLLADGKLNAVAEIFGERTTAAGYWAVEEDLVTLTITHEDGEEKEEFDVTSCRLAGERLYLKDEDMPFAFVLEKLAGPGGEVPAVPRPESPPEELPAEPEGAAGTYVLDREKMLPALEKAMLDPLEELLEGMTEDERAAAIADARQRAEGLLGLMNFEVLLLVDGSFVVTGADVDVRGTWEADGETITFATAWENGEDLQEPKVRPGRIVDGDIHFKPEENMPFELILTRK